MAALGVAPQRTDLSPNDRPPHGCARLGVAALGAATHRTDL